MSDDRIKAWWWIARHPFKAAAIRRYVADEDVRSMTACPHCDPDHSKFSAHPWSARVSTERDGDGQPTHLIVARADGGHVAESDAEAVRALLAQS